MSMKSEARGPIEDTHCLSDSDCAHRPCASCGCKCINSCCVCQSKPYLVDDFCNINAINAPTN